MSHRSVEVERPFLTQTFRVRAYPVGAFLEATMMILCDVLYASYANVEIFPWQSE